MIEYGEYGIIIFFSNADVIRGLDEYVFIYVKIRDLVISIDLFAESFSS